MNRKERFLEAVDVVCGECACLKESECENCPVKRTVNMLDIPKGLKNKRIFAIIRNWRGLKEENYLFTEEGLKSFIADDKEFERIMFEIENFDESDSFDYAANDTFTIWEINPEEIIDFLKGCYNENQMEMLINNYDKRLTPDENYEKYSDWYFEFMENESSKEQVDAIKESPYLYSLTENNGKLPEREEVFKTLVECFAS